MKKLSFAILVSILALVFSSCANSTVAERKPVPPQGSDLSDQPWNAPRPGEGAGALGGLLDGR